MDLSGLTTFSLQNAPWREHLVRILSAALDCVDPALAVERFVRREGWRIVIDSQEYDLKKYNRVFLIGAGKAGAPMAHAVGRLLGENLTTGLVIVKEGHIGQIQPAIPGLEVLEAGHPLPDSRGLQATERIIHLLEGTRVGDLVFCLISGGGSALLTAPVEGVSLSDVGVLTDALLGSGATINEINILRKHLDRVKGGRLASMAAPASLATLILSDVVGNPLDVIASGPTVPDATTYSDALDVLERYRLVGKIPSPIVQYLERGASGEVSETPKPADPVFRGVQNLIIGSNLQAAGAAFRQAQTEGYHSLLLTTYLQGEASQVGRFLASILRQVAETGQPVPRPACLVVGGETTVTLSADGLGGRNQELALAAVSELDGLPDVALITFATDGGDGPTDAAGALVTGETCQRALQAGIDPQEYLARNDSYTFFFQLGDLIKIGPTQTNVNDLVLLFAR